MTAMNTWQDLPAIPTTPMDIFRSLPAGTRAEIIDNVIYMPPSPFIQHQKVSMSLSAELYLHFKKQGKGTVFAAPLDVYFDETSNAVQPDIIVVLEGNNANLADNGHMHGVPNIIIEILSQGNKDYDLIRKKDLYERFGVREYFVVEPESGLVLHYELREGRYTLTQEKIKQLQSKLMDHTFEW